MTEVQTDLLEIKLTLEDMKKNISKIENRLRDDYFDDKILEMQYGDDNYKYRMKIDDCMNALLQTKQEYKDNAKIQEYCDTALAALHKQYIELSIERNKEYNKCK